MKNKNNIIESLEKEAPFLAKIEKKNHFSTPKDYFEVLPQIISSKNLNYNSLNISLDKLSYRIFLPFASVVTLLFVVFNWNTNTTEKELTHEQLSELIINDNYLEIEDYLIYETYAEIIEKEEIETMEDEYINYLVENNIDINLIIEEL